MKKNRLKKRKMKRQFLIGLLCLLIGIMFITKLVHMKTQKVEHDDSPEELLVQYMNYIPLREYEKMYAMLDVEQSGDISRGDFIKRNSAIYEGIEAENITIEILSYDAKHCQVTYQMAFDTIADSVCFTNCASWVKGEDGYKLIWKDNLIFPDLERTDKVRISTTQARRGEILDRDGHVLAGQGVADSVGIVPGKMVDREQTISEIAYLLGIDNKIIEEKLSAQWVQEDSFVPIKTIPVVKELELTSIEPDEEALFEKDRHDKLLQLPGVMITEVEIRTYPLGEAAAHLVGYVQGVTAEDLEEHTGEGYTANSVIGRTGIESLYEEQLKGVNGCKIYIVDADENEKKTIATKYVRPGQNVRLTIDAGLQTGLYEKFKDDKGCSVAMNPYTGEVLALVSTPSYDVNDFILGLSDEQWKEISEDENKPLYNRFREVWCPGSTLKPIIAAIGMETGAIDSMIDYGNCGTAWQKDTSWGSYYITTLHTYTPVTLENALIYSDNIYFARAALRIGTDNLEMYFRRLGFCSENPFEIRMSKSEYSTAEHIASDIQLADSGYGQGQILVNPLHLACMYSVFCNAGNMIRPRLLYEEHVQPDYWVLNVFSKQTTDTVLSGMTMVINSEHGTGYAAHMDDVVLAGKTGTAEIKMSQEDTTGTELGWFAVFTADETMEHPVLIVSMVEDVKWRGGSHYVVQKDRQVIETWIHNH